MLFVFFTYRHVLLGVSIKLVLQFTGIRNRGYKTKSHKSPSKEKQTRKQEDMDGTFLGIFPNPWVCPLSDNSRCLSSPCQSHCSQHFLSSTGLLTSCAQALLGLFLFPLRHLSFPSPEPLLIAQLSLPCHPLVLAHPASLPPPSCSTSIPTYS